MVMEEWEYHHSTRLDEPVRMVVFSFVYDQLDAEIFDETSNGAVPKVIKTPI